VLVVTAFKRVTVALLGAAGTGKKCLAEAMNNALRKSLASTPELHWEITTDTALQRLLQRDNANLDTASPDFKEAVAQQRRFDYSLLLGLDLAPSARALQPHSAAERNRMDTLLRRSLTQANVPFQVIYGTGDERLQQVLSALGALKSPAAKAETPQEEPANPRKPWVWACDKCSDPVCEHRLLSDLLLKR
jgi:nicotinamide riboside kinase